MEKRKLKLVKVTEPDGVTPKVAHPDQNFSYDDIVGQTFIESYGTEVGYSALFIPTSPDVLDGNALRTSSVQNIVQNFDVSDNAEFANKLEVTTRNTVYTFAVIE